MTFALLIMLWNLNVSLLACLTVPSGSVTNFNARDVTSFSVELNWDPVNERDQNGIILSYSIYYQLNDSFDAYTVLLGVTERVSGSNMHQDAYNSKKT